MGGFGNNFGNNFRLSVYGVFKRYITLTLKRKKTQVTAGGKTV